MLKNEIIAGLYVVSTPIGNLDDMTWRARQTLASVDIIAAEDTRHSAKLLSHLEIKGKQVISYYDEIEERRSPELIRYILEDKKSVALVSDAGTPCICDPGYRLVAAARAAGIRVIPVPGVCAISTLLAACGLPAHRFLFVGFLPSKKEALKKEMSSWLSFEFPIICYESPNRIIKSLNFMAELFPQAQVAIGRELTKLHEEIVTYTVEEAVSWAESHQTLKGEFVLMLSPSKQQRSKEAIIAQIEGELAVILTEADQAGNKPTHKDLLKHFAMHGLNKRELYALLLDASKNQLNS